MDQFCKAYIKEWSYEDSRSTSIIWYNSLSPTKDDNSSFARNNEAEVSCAHLSAFLIGIEVPELHFQSFCHFHLLVFAKLTVPPVSPIWNLKQTSHNLTNTVIWNNRLDVSHHTWRFKENLISHMQSSPFIHSTVLDPNIGRHHEIFTGSSITKTCQLLFNCLNYKTQPMTSAICTDLAIQASATH